MTDLFVICHCCRGRRFFPSAKGAIACGTCAGKGTLELALPATDALRRLAALEAAARRSGA